MENSEVHKGRENIADLAGGILADTQKLVEQHVQLAKLQLFQDWGSAKPVVVWFTIGVVAAILVGILFTVSLVYFLNDKTELPLWQCYGLVASVALIVAVISFLVVSVKAKEFSS